METVTYLCPGCGAYLRYDGGKGKWVCDYCDSEYTREELEQRGAVQEDSSYEVSPGDSGETGKLEFDYQENVSGQQAQEHLRAYHCPSCGAEIITDDVTAATFCVFCQNPTILPQKFSGKYQPSAIIPFQTDKEQAKQAFLKLCKGKKLLPSGYTSEQRLEKITGVYVPFWLFDCSADFDYHATGEIHTSWSDGNFNYTKIDMYHIHRAGVMDFEHIPLDASEKMQDDLMDALEPFDFSKAEPFDIRYLSGYLAEKYTYAPKDLYERMTNRISPGVQRQAGEGSRPYHSVHSVRCDTKFKSEKQEYLLLPVWMLMSRYKDKNYLFAMNGQTGKIVGQLPVDGGKSVKWFFIIFFISMVITGILAFLVGGVLL